MKKAAWFFAVAAGCILAFASGNATAENFSKQFSPLPKQSVNKDNPSNAAKVELGKMLFFEPRLSKSGAISCNSCHNLATAGVDNMSTSIGHGWQIGPRNAPTVLNASFLGSQFWDGRAKDVEEQAGGPILNSKEMGSSETLVLERLNSMPEYVALFKKAYPGDKSPLRYENVAKAIAAYERTLITPSRFDDFLRGEDNSLTLKEKKGLRLFVDKGCVGCHNGVSIGGGKFTAFNYGTDDGRFNVTKNEADKKVFRVSSLRNVALTYPYFHDGSVWELEEAIRIMGEKQLGVKLNDDEVRSIAAFLRSLNGRAPEVTLPVLPPSVASTPKPDVK